jgi:hypothetical protein
MQALPNCIPSEVLARVINHTLPLPLSIPFLVVLYRWKGFSAYILYLFCSDILIKEGPNGEMQRAWDKWEEPDGCVIHLDPMLIYCTYVSLLFANVSIFCSRVIEFC